MKTIFIKHLVYLVTLLVLGYFSLSFITLQLNPISWNIDYRISFIVYSAFIIVFVIYSTELEILQLKDC